MPSIKQHFKHHPTQESIELKRMFDAVLADMTTLRTYCVTLETSIEVITAQLDADAGVTDTDYAANADPATIGALTVTS